MLTPLESAFSDYDKNFLSNWDRVFTEYKTETDKLWLAGPSSYIFSVAGIRFGVDIQVRRQKDIDAVLPRLVKDTDALSFMLITHQHGDHMCVPLIHALKDTDIKFYIPYGTRADYMERCDLKPENIVWVKDGDEFDEGDVHIRAFFSPHSRTGDEIFLQVGYELTYPSGKTVILGDVRNYSYAGYPDFDKIDLCIAHLWAGDDSSAPEKYMPMLEQFCNCISKLDADKYYLCHLYELGREADKLWNYTHAGIATDMMYALKPESVVEVARVGQSYDISCR